MDPLIAFTLHNSTSRLSQFGEHALYGEVVPQKHPVHQAAPTTYLESKHQLDLSNLHEATNWLRR